MQMKLQALTASLAWSYTANLDACGITHAPDKVADIGAVVGLQSTKDGLTALSKAIPDELERGQSP